MKVIYIKIPLFAVALAILASCSMPKFLYNNADTILFYWFDAHFNLREDQSLDLKSKIEAFHRWHRKTELPKTILILQDIGHRYKSGINVEDISWVMVRFEEAWERMLSHVENDLISFLLTVDENQVLHMKMKLLEKDELLIRQAKMNSIELHESILDRLYGILEDWFGSLEPEQKSKMERWVEPDLKWIIIKLKNREKIRADLVRLLRAQDTLKENLYVWKNRPESHWTEEFKIQVEEKKQEWINFFLKVDSITLPYQRAHVSNKLQGYINDLSELSKS